MTKTSVPTDTTVPTDQPVPPQTAESGPPTSPTDLPARDWKDSLRRTAKEFKDDRGSLVAAGMAFYWFLAIFPGILAAVGILGLVGLSADTLADILNGIRTTLPPAAADVLTAAIEKAGNQPKGSSIIATVVGLGLALWSASAGMVAVQTGCDVAYDLPGDRKFVAKRAMALLLVVVTALLAGVASALIVFGEPLGGALRDHLPFGDAFVVLWTILRWALGLAALVVLFACMYSIAPNRETPRWTWVSPGGIVATVGWLLASLAFSFYVSSAGSYAETYGSITGVVLLLLWLYLSALAVVAGAELNAELERQGEIRRRKDTRPERRGFGDARPAAATAAPAAAAPTAVATDSRATVGSVRGRRRRRSEAPAATPRALTTAPMPSSATRGTVPSATAGDGKGNDSGTGDGDGDGTATGSREGSYQDAWVAYGRRAREESGR